jgi:hypothetical protein
MLDMAQNCFGVPNLEDSLRVSRIGTGRQRGRRKFPDLLQLSERDLQVGYGVFFLHRGLPPNAWGLDAATKHLARLEIIEKERQTFTH